MKLNAWWLPILLIGSLGMVHLLPQAGAVAGSAVKMDLPGTVGGWVFTPLAASPEELGTLSADTEFAKAMCLRPRPDEVALDGRLIPDRIDLSVVLSGHDLNNSIHRPERCMPAQGHVITSSSSLTLAMANGRSFNAKRLHSLQTLKASANDSRAFQCVTYYFFVGHDRITNDHLQRTWIDMQDRLVRGMDQRWAYVSASIWFGKLPWLDKEVTEAEADENLCNFVRDFAQNQIDWNQITR